MWGGELFVPKIPSYRITDLAEAVNAECHIEIVGIRPGEKLHEQLITENDALNTIEFKNHCVILPAAHPGWDIDRFIDESNSEPGSFTPDGFIQQWDK